MANNVKVTLLGNLTRDPEMKDVNGSSVMTISVAVNTDVKNQDGTYKTDFYEVSVWGKQGENLMQRLQKGTGVWVNGDLTTNEYVGRDGKNHIALRVRGTDVRGVARLKGGDAQAKPATKAVPQMTAEDDVMPF